MKNTWRLIRRFVFTLILSLIILFILNVILLVSYTYSDTNTKGGWQAAEEMSGALSAREDGSFVLSQEGEELLKEQGVWALLVEDGSGNVIWHSENLPPEIPLHYSVSDISWSTRGYIMDYPTTTSARGEDLVILGHPKTKYWKHMWNTWDYQLIANSPKLILRTIGINLLLIVVIYIVSTSGIIRSVKPIVDGIEGLPEGKDVYVKEKGLLSGLAVAINRSAERLRSQEYALKKKERAQADWIAGVSHDIRTPLSMVMGYAGQLEDNRLLPDEARSQAKVIRIQSMRMKNLVNDLNLYSKLEYSMQPVNKRPVNLVAVVRLSAADFINLDLEGRYPVELEISGDASSCMLEGDKELLHRAVNNILTNVRVHNPEGCRIFIKMERDMEKAELTVEDDGKGISEEELERLKNKPHYMISDGTRRGERHGLGLLIVRQIVEAHGGNVEFGHGRGGSGFCVRMWWRLCEM